MSDNEARQARRYVIMANGKGLRWHNHLGVPKHLITVDGVPLLDRLVDQLVALDPEADVVISSSDHRAETVGAWRHRPCRNELELDRFVPELVTNDVTFLYGDTYYSDEAILEIVEGDGEPVQFYGDSERVAAVRARDPELFLSAFAELRAMAVKELLTECKGWQLFRLLEGLPLEAGAPDTDQLRSAASFVLLSARLWDFNTPQDFERFREEKALS